MNQLTPKYCSKPKSLAIDLITLLLDNYPNLGSDIGLTNSLFTAHINLDPEVTVIQYINYRFIAERVYIMFGGEQLFIETKHYPKLRLEVGTNAIQKPLAGRLYIYLRDYKTYGKIKQLLADHNIKI